MTSILWRKIVTELHEKEYSDIEFSGCFSGGKFSHLGPPTEPKSTALEFSHN